MAKGNGSGDAARIVRVAKSLSHPLRISILEAVSDRNLSPVAYSRAEEKSLGTVSYHFKTLAKLGALEVAEEVPRRGALEHRYVATADGRALQHLIGELRTA